VATISRAGLLVLAVTICAWFALGVHQALDTNRAAALIGNLTSLRASEAQRASSLLSSAEKLNPDLTPDILRGELAFNQRRDATSVRILESVTQREPLNLEAWSALALAAARTGDRATLTRAARNISALHPKLR
jgi:predicted Zn-dependent protease